MKKQLAKSWWKWHKNSVTANRLFNIIVLLANVIEFKVWNLGIITTCVQRDCWALNSKLNGTKCNTTNVCVLWAKSWWNWEQVSILNLTSKFSLLTDWLCNFLVKVYWRKSCWWNVSEIDSRGQFYWHFTRNFSANIFAPKKIQSRNVTGEKLSKALLYEKFALIMLM